MMDVKRPTRAVGRSGVSRLLERAAKACRGTHEDHRVGGGAHRPHDAPGSRRTDPGRILQSGAEKVAIETLLATYTTAVSTKNEALFEGLLLDKDIPFSGVGAGDRSGGKVVTADYESFRKGVFHGPPFTQRFQDVHIDQDGRLASVSLVFINTAASGASWGWKTLQLLKVDGRWRIASEFYTNHQG